MRKNKIFNQYLENTKLTFDIINQPENPNLISSFTTVPYYNAKYTVYYQKITNTDNHIGYNLYYENYTLENKRWFCKLTVENVFKLTTTFRNNVHLTWD